MHKTLQLLTTADANFIKGFTWEKVQQKRSGCGQIYSQTASSSFFPSSEDKKLLIVSTTKNLTFGFTETSPCGLCLPELLGHTQPYNFHCMLKLLLVWSWCTWLKLLILHTLTAQMITQKSIWDQFKLKNKKKQKQQQFTTSEVAIQSKNCGLDYLTCFVHKHSIIFNFILFIQHHRNNSRLRAPYTVL